jgi:hypothetical protein
MYRRLLWVSSVQNRAPRVSGEARIIRVRAETCASLRSASSSSCLAKPCTAAQQDYNYSDQSLRWPISSLPVLPVHPRSLAGNSALNAAATAGARYFSTSPDADVTTKSSGAGGGGSAAELKARRRKLALRKRLKIRSDRIKTKKKPSTSSNSGTKQFLRRHDPATFQTLFDQIAPCHALVKFDEVISRLQIKMKQDSDSVLPLYTVLLGMLHSTNPNSTVAITVLELLLSATKGSSLKKENMTMAGAADENDSLIEEVNAVALLAAARELSLEHALGWNRFDLEAVTKEPAVMEERHALHAAKVEADVGADLLQQEARQLAVTLVENLPHKNFRSVIRIFEAYVNDNAQTESEGPSAVSDESEMDDMSSSEETKTEEMKPKATAGIATKKKKKLRKLRFELEKATGAQFHLVAADTANFFYMNVGLDYNVTATDGHIIVLQEKWIQAKEKFVHVMVDIQEKLLASVENMDDSEVQVIDESEHAKSESGGDVINEQDLLLTTPSKIKKNEDRRFRRPAHVVFDAMALALHEGAETEDFSSVTAPAQSTVFVENLPVDITKEELTELYSRCGELESVHIFNQRPDLDPGKLKKMEVIARRKKQLQNVTSHFRKWQRPRTPVYGMLKFNSPDGYQVAVNDSLRIFGMMVRKHPVRSMRSSDMTRIYLEGIPAGQPCVDLEYQLSQQLHPDLFVCLDAGQNNSAVVGSCEINFPTFEAALESYHKLQELDMFSNSDSESKGTLNWFRTPRDAEQWWTRKLGFD